MVVHSPFLRWDIIRNPPNSSARKMLYYLKTAQGQQLIAAVAVRGQDNRLVYKPFVQFVEDYQDLLSLGGLRTACLPSTVTTENTVDKFVYFNVYGPDLRNNCFPERKGEEMAFTGTLDKCKACNKIVYFVDLLTADGIIYHNSCFKCTHCKGTLVMSNYSSKDGNLYC